MVINLHTVLVIVVLLFIVGMFSGWPGRGYNAQGDYGYYPFGGFGLVVAILVILLLLGRI